MAQLFHVERRRIDAGEEEIETLFFDATEQPVQRPGQKKPRSDCTIRASIKSTRPGEGPQIAVDQDEKIRATSPSYPGSVHDKRVYDTEQVVIPRGTEALGDLGDQGSVLTVPEKKPKGESLSGEAKFYNRACASFASSRRACNRDAQDI